MICSKKSLLKKKLIFLSLLIFSFSELTGQSNNEYIKLLDVSDIHFCRLDQYNTDFANSRKHFGDVFGSLTKLFNEVVPKNFDAMVVTGDMVDFYEAESLNNMMVSTQIEQFASFLNSVNSANIPVYMTLGNHDVTSYWVEGGKNKNTQNNFEVAKATWVKNIDCFKNGVNYRVSYNLKNTDYSLYFIDNSFYNPSRKDSLDQFIIDEKNLIWLEDELKKRPTEIAIILMHMPLIRYDSKLIKYINNIKESNHTNPIVNEINISDETLKKTLRLKENMLLNIVVKNPSVKLIIGGHQHESILTKLNLGKDRALYQVMTGAFGRTKSNWGEFRANQWREIRLYENKIDIYYPKISKIQFSLPVD